jgi:ribokinase
VDDAGENSIVVVLGANLAVSKADVDAAADLIAQADVVVTQLEINYEATAYALKVAKDRGVRTVLNPAPAGQVGRDVLALADFITPNETELEALVGGSGNSVEQAARSLLIKDQQTVIVTLGAQGAQWVRKGDAALVPAYKVDVVDTTGAGDAFNGGLAVGLAEGKQLHDAIAFANATAALCVTRPGTAPSMPRRDEVERLLTSQ